MHHRAASILAAILITSSLASGQSHHDPVDLYLKRATKMKLAEHPQWLALLHYEEKAFLPGRESAVRTATFFLSPEGAKNARAELSATLSALLDPQARSARGETVACAYPARARWLREELGLSDDAFANVDCPELEKWKRDLRPRALTLVFPEAFMNSPASMFGHTLLRIDVSVDEEAENLLAHAIDFTADTGGEAGPLYLLKGTMGLYPGRFGLNPYHQKLAQYGDWQNRDIWEYRLNLSAEEIDAVLLHLWELRDVAFPYFFFNENCSYRLVRLLQTVREDLSLAAGFPVGVIPIDTVRGVVADTQLVGQVRYRPSPATALRWALEKRSDATVELALAMARGELSPDASELQSLSHEEQVQALTLAYDALRYRFLADEVPQEESRPRSHALLVARSRLGQAKEFEAPPTPALRPDLSHGTAMFSVAGGLEDREPYVDFRIRPALHDRLDPEPGDSEIRVLDTTLRYFPAEQRVRLHELVALALRSHSARDSFFKPLSWHIETGLRTRLRPEGGGELDPEAVWRSEGGLGFNWQPRSWLQTYLLAELRAEVGGTLDGDFALGPGLTIGSEFGRRYSRWRTRFELRGFQFVAGDKATVLRARLEQRVKLSRNLALVGRVAWHHDDRRSWSDARLELRAYF